MVAVLKRQIEKTQKNLEATGYDPASVRDQVVALAQSYGSPVLDVGTGACAYMAVDLARSGLTVTAIDHASSAIRIAEERVTGALINNLKVQQAKATRLPFLDNSYRVVTVFDALCHAADPVAVVAEMFRVCSNGGAIIVTELNNAGRRVTHHLDYGFEKKLPDLLVHYCNNCQQLDDIHHVTQVCEIRKSLY